MNDSNVDTAMACFQMGCNCAQAVLTTYCDTFGLNQSTALALTTGFGGGMARHGEVCGAVTGAIMAIGLKHGMKNKNETEARDLTYQLVTEFVNKFKSQHSSIRCNDLLGCDINTEKGREEAKNADLFNTKCPKLVGSAVEILEEIM